MAHPSIVALDQHSRVIAGLTGEQAIHGFVPVLEAIKTIQTWRSQQKSLGHAPILVVDRIFDIPLCRQLIDCYKEHGGRQSGFMREVNGVTAEFHDDAIKRRRDVMIADDGLRNAVRAMISHRLIPLIRQAFNFEVTRIERDMVACYDSADQGFFNAHRDNTTKGTAHRKFAVTINLNSEEYDGGDLIFPEFSGETYRAPTGGAIVFSGALLHQANAVTRGVRYAYLPFLFGEAEAKIQLENSRFLDIKNGGLAEAASA